MISRSTYLYREARFEASHERAGWPESGLFEVAGGKRAGSLIQIGEKTSGRTGRDARREREMAGEGVGTLVGGERLEKRANG